MQPHAVQAALALALVGAAHGLDVRDLAAARAEGRRAAERGLAGIHVNGSALREALRGLREAFPAPAGLPRAGPRVPAGPPGGVATVAYHKTGSFFCKFFHPLVANVSVQLFHQRIFKEDFQNSVFSRPAAGRFWTGPLEWPSPQHLHVSSLAAQGALPAGGRVVHWYRDPVQLVLSAYRYHLAMDPASAAFEAWNFVPQRCAWCDEDAHTAIFGACVFRRCSYSSLLGHLDATTGVELELLHSRATLQHMSRNVERWANDGNVLHLSVEHLFSDFNQTVVCMLNFLGLSDSQSLLQRLQVLSPQRSWPHATRAKYDNRLLEEHLENLPSLAAPTAALRRLLRDINLRQSEAFGCPESPAVQVPQ